MEVPWATDAHLVTVGGQAKVAIAAMDRTLSLLHVLPAELDPHRPNERSCLAVAAISRLPATSGPATCITSLPAEERAHGCPEVRQGSAEEGARTLEGVQLVYGDKQGAVTLVKALPPMCPFLGPGCYQVEDLPATSRQQLHREHTDWVTQLLHAPRVGLLSSSLDGTIKIFDPVRGTVIATSTAHNAAVRCMAFDPGLAMVARYENARPCNCFPTQSELPTIHLQPPAARLQAMFQQFSAFYTYFIKH